MKLIRLEILNLASLDRPEGEVIDFTQGALGESNIFSIVGPTGSGKSTLLDAICLALYNRAPRYPRVARQHNNIEIYGTPDESELNRLAPTDCRNILTRGKNNGYSKLTFLANNGTIYRAEWHVRFNRTRYANTVKLLYKLSTSSDGTPIEEEADWNELPQIIGLDYEQFLRTVLIAQGSFANFLTAKEDERFALLEKLIGCEELYTSIAQTIKERFKAAETTYNQVSASVDAVKQNLLDDDALQALQAEIKELDEAEKALTETLKQVEKELQWFVDDEKKSQAIVDCQAEETKAKEALAAKASDFARLSLHDAIDPAVDLLREVKRLENEIKKLNDEIADTGRDIIGQEKRIQAATRHLNELKDTAEKALALAEEELRKMKTAFEKERKDHQAHVLDITTRLQSEQQKIQGQDADALQKAKTRADHALRDLQDAITIVDNLGKTVKEKQDKEKTRAQLQEQNKQLNEELCKLDIESLNKEVDTLRRIYTLTTSEQWSQHRDLLHEGSPCPLCGATQHPYLEDSTQAQMVVTELHELLTTKENELKNRQKRQSDFSGAIKTNEGKIGELDKRLQQLSENMNELEGKWDAMRQQYPLLPHELESLKALVPSHEQTKQQADDTLARYNKVKQCIDDWVKQKEEATDVLTNFEKKASEDISIFKDGLNSYKTVLAELRALTPTLSQQYDDSQKTAEETTSSCQITSQELEKLQKTFKRELDESQAELSKLQGIQQKQSQLMEDHKREMEAKNGELNKWLDEYNARADKLKEITIDDVSDMLAATDNWETIRSTKERLIKAIHSTGALLDQARKEHESHQTSKPELPKEALVAHQQELQQSSQHDKLIELNTRLKSHNDAIVQLGDKAKELEDATRDKQDWGQINDSIGGDGKLLRKIAQCYTLGFLIEHANEEIRKFNSRYELQQVKNSLGIRVIDHDRADDVRDTTSLSGGETFIVSLGLALGLSSLSSRNISFDNLFIDEGFGTLDPDTLATVIDSLAMLQMSQGKKVGVISHTDTMSERITTQIRVVKNGSSGSSHIEIYS